MAGVYLTFLMGSLKKSKSFEYLDYGVVNSLRNANTFFPSSHQIHEYGMYSSMDISKIQV